MREVDISDYIRSEAISRAVLPVNPIPDPLWVDVRTGLPVAPIGFAAATHSMSVLEFNHTIVPSLAEDYKIFESHINSMFKTPGWKQRERIKRMQSVV